MDIQAPQGLFQILHHALLDDDMKFFLFYRTFFLFN